MPSIDYKGGIFNFEEIEKHGLIWMDRNLGASRVPLTYDDSEGLGDLFQWGREDDGHQSRDSDSVEGSFGDPKDSDSPGHDKFIYGGGLSDNSDWRDPQNNNLWKDGLNVTAHLKGWRLPTETELETEMNSWGNSGNRLVDAFNSSLKWPECGYRWYSTGMVNKETSYIWSSDVNTPPSTRAMAFWYDSGWAQTDTFRRGCGAGVRLVKDVLSPISSMTIKSAPTKTNYSYYENIDLTGLEIRIEREDASIQDIVLDDFYKERITTEPADGETITSPIDNIVITYNPEEVSVNQAIETEDSPVIGLSIETKPTKLKYRVGDSLDLTGLTVKLFKDDGTSSVISPIDFSSNVVSINLPSQTAMLNTPGTFYLVCSHTVTGKQDSFRISIEEDIDFSTEYIKKEIFINSYDSDGTLIKRIEDATFTGFKKTINGGLSSLTFKLARRADEYNEDEDVSIGNRIDILVFDKDSPDFENYEAVKIYSGYVEEHRINSDGEKEFVEVLCIGLVSKLNNDILRIGSDIVISTDSSSILVDGVTSSSVDDVSDLLKKIIDTYNTYNPLFSVSYTDSDGLSTIEDTNKSINCIFKVSTYYDAIEKCREVSPQLWYWFLDADEILTFKPISSLPVHDFIFNKNMSKIEIVKTLQSTKNVLILNTNSSDSTSFSACRKYENSNSVEKYGRRVKYTTENSFTDTDTMDNFGESFIEENKEVVYKIKITLIDNNNNDNGYDIESVNPGDTCRILNLKNSEDISGVSMVISEVEWTPNYAVVTLNMSGFDFEKYLLNLRKDIEKEERDESELSYTEVS
ncbi:MAG: hypothetical protein M0R03_14960 [Novosphingobium sp.]|nr:hypothetical protein [Novosphingobium sp.]